MNFFLTHSRLTTRIYSLSNDSYFKQKQTQTGKKAIDILYADSQEQRIKITSHGHHFVLSFCQKYVCWRSL